METKTKLTEIEPLGITIGGSKIAAVCGLSKYTTPHQAWLQLMGKGTTTDNDVMAIGRSLEQGVIDYYLNKYNISKEAINQQVKIQIGSASASIDMVVNHPDGNTEIVEVKTTRTPDIDDSWVMQLQWYIGLYKLQTGKTAKGKLLVLRPFLSIEETDVEFDQELFDLMDYKAGEFYTNYIINDAEPPKKHFEITPTEAIPDTKVIDNLQDDVELLQSLKSQKKALEEQIEKLEDKIKAEIGEYETAVCGHYNLSYKFSSREVAIMEKIKQLPNYKEFIKVTTYRVFRISNRK